MWNLQINGIYSIIKNVTFAINGPGANGIAVFSGSNDVLDSVELLYQSGLTSTVLGSIKYMNNTTVNGVVIDN